MRVAIVHELLTHLGGAERIAALFAQWFPQAPIFTLLYDEQQCGEIFSPERVIASPLQRSWRPRRAQIGLMPSAIESFDLTEYDLVLTSSSAFAHGVITRPECRQVSYIHSPARYLWDQAAAVEADQCQGMLGPLKRSWLHRQQFALRQWDVLASCRSDVLIANSHIVQDRISKYWRRDSDVIHPAVDVSGIPLRSMPATADSPFVIISTLSPYKRIDTAVEAMRAFPQEHLHIYGDGADRARLESLAPSNVHFHGRCSDQERVLALQTAKAFLFPGEDDFGIAPVEALAAGTPVIALGRGGATETIVSGYSGFLYNEPTTVDLVRMLELFLERGLSTTPQQLRSAAERFSSEQFYDQFQPYLSR